MTGRGERLKRTRDWAFSLKRPSAERALQPLKLKKVHCVDCDKLFVCVENAERRCWQCWLMAQASPFRTNSKP